MSGGGQLRSGHVEPEPHGGLTLHRLTLVLSRHRWLVVQAVVLVPLAAAVLSLRQSKEYRAEAQVLIGRHSYAGAFTGVGEPALNLQPERVLRTSAALARLPEVARRALAAAGVAETPQRLLAHSSVAVRQNTDLLAFRVENGSPALAERLATAYATAFAGYRRELDLGPVAKARAQIASSLAHLARNGASAGAFANRLRNRDQELATLGALESENATVVESPTTAPRVRPQVLRNTLLGVVAGLALGVALAFGRDGLAARARTAGAPALSLVPPLPRGANGDREASL
jgi:capsular polysaccharide biosynthesis protein